MEHELQASLAYKNPDVFWRLWSSATEEAIVHVCAHSAGERRHYTGHGNATYMLRKHRASQVFQDHEQHAAFSTKEANTQHRATRQKNKQTNRSAWPTDVRNTWENAAHNEMWTQHTSMTNENTDLVGCFDKEPTQSHTKHRTTAVSCRRVVHYNAQNMYVQQEHNITDITMQQLRDAFSNVKKNATGPDAWTMSRSVG